MIQPLAEAAQERIPGYSYPSQMERFRVVEELRTNDLSTKPLFGQYK